MPHAIPVHMKPSSNKDRLYIALYARGGDSVMPGGEDKQVNPCQHSQHDPIYHSNPPVTNPTPAHPPTRYHWALLVGPKHETPNSKGKRFHVKETMTMTAGAGADGRTRPRPRWVYEERDIGMNPTAMILARVLVGKVTSAERLAAVLRGVPVRGAGRPGWNCVWWVSEALGMLGREREQGGGGGRAVLSRTSVTGWEAVRGAAMGFVERKEREHRFDGCAPPGRFDVDRVATYDLLRMEEVVA